MSQSTATQPQATTSEAPRTRIGFVTSDKTDKTRKVEIEHLAKHPKYGKYVRKRTVLHVHDDANASKAGDKVEVEPCRPMSKTKRWRLVRVVERSLD